MLSFANSTDETAPCVHGTTPCTDETAPCVHGTTPSTDETAPCVHAELLRADF